MSAEKKINDVIILFTLLCILYFGFLIVGGGFYSNKYGVLISFGDYNSMVGCFFIFFSIYFIVKIAANLKN